MNTVTQSVKKARRRVRGLDSLKNAKARVHRQNRRRARQLLRRNEFDRFEPVRLTSRHLC